MRSVVALAAVAGCYSPIAHDGVSCQPETPACPDGQTCQPVGNHFACEFTTTSPDARADSPAEPNDVDGDGIANASDNCPNVANPDQANEDGDGFGDACDDCPPFPSTGADADGDGVGDLCDPHPTTPGDSIVLFEGFANGMPPMWTATGPWTVSNGDLISTVTANNLNTLVVPFTDSPHQTIYSRAMITALTSTSGGSIGIVDKFDAAGNAGVHCGGARGGTAAYFALVDAASGSILSNANHAFAVSTSYDLVYTRTDNTYDCTTNDTSPPITVTAAPTITGGPYIGFRNRIASGSFAWILVVRSP
jgi:hypothetical protein